MIDRAIEMRALGVTPEYVASLRAAAPHLRLDHDDLVEMKAVGVTPDYIQRPGARPLRGLDKDDLVEARALGVRSDYIRAMNAAGYPNLTLDQLVELRAVGVTAGLHREASTRRLRPDQRRQAGRDEGARHRPRRSEARRRLTGRSLT